jgi:hypothetical protein
VLNPARLWKKLLKLFLGNRANVSFMIEKKGPRAGGTLVKGKYEFFHNQ